MAVDEEFQTRDEDTKGVDSVLDVNTVGIGRAEPKSATKDGGYLVAVG